jgi:hypothetical protein
MVPERGKYQIGYFTDDPEAFFGITVKLEVASADTAYLQGRMVFARDANGNSFACGQS